MRFVGVDLGWFGKPSGLASLQLGADGRLRLTSIDRLQPADEILEWVEREDASVVAVDAPLVIANETGIREAERELNRDYRRFHAGCHAANLGRPFAQHVLAFSAGLRALGYGHGAAVAARASGRFQIEVHPHAATVALFGLERIVKYKRGRRAERARELARLRGLMLERMPALRPALDLELPPIPEAGALKPVEDRIDAVMCAYIAAHWWRWGRERNRVYGSEEGGYVVTPELVGGGSALHATDHDAH